jgi:putative peptidoglycan lipid II flippase
MGPLQHLGPPLASSVAAWFNVAALAAILMRRGHLVMDSGLRRTVPRMLLAGLVMVAVLLALRWGVFSPIAGTGFGRWVGLAVLVCGGFLAYGAAGQMLRAFDLRELMGGPRRRRQRI